MAKIIYKTSEILPKIQKFSDYLENLVKEEEEEEKKSLWNKFFPPPSYYVPGLHYEYQRLYLKRLIQMCKTSDEIILENKDFEYLRNCLE